MTRQDDIMRSFVEMADTLVEDFDVVDLLTGLAERCVNPVSYTHLTLPTNREV